MSIVINPGSGPVGGATREQADACMHQFIADLGLDGVTSEYVKPCLGIKQVGTWPDVKFVDGDPDGRFLYQLRLDDKQCPVEMPGLSVEKVRWMKEPGQNIWDFPRLYVAEGSWVWLYGINVAVSSLTGEYDDDE